MARRREERTLRSDISELLVNTLARCSILGWIGCFSDIAAVVYRKVIACVWVLACGFAYSVQVLN